MNGETERPSTESPPEMLEEKVGEHPTVNVDNLLSRLQEIERRINILKQRSVSEKLSGFLPSKCACCCHQ